MLKSKIHNIKDIIKNLTHKTFLMGKECLIQKNLLFKEVFLKTSNVRTCSKYIKKFLHKNKS